MTTEPRFSVDAIPGAHFWLDALATCSFKLGCGCSIPMSKPEDAQEAHLIKIVGAQYPCSKHGEQVITRSTLRLAGWKEPSKEARAMRESFVRSADG